MLHIFSRKLDPDRQLLMDRNAREAIRRVVRGTNRSGNQNCVLLNLCDGLRRIGVQFRINDFSVREA